MKFVSAACLVVGSLFIALALYQLNQYWMASSTVGPSLTKLNEMTQDASSLQALGLKATDIEETKNAVLAGSNSLLQNFVLDLVLGLVLLFAGFRTEKQHNL